MQTLAGLIWSSPRPKGADAVVHLPRQAMKSLALILPLQDSLEMRKPGSYFVVRSQVSMKMRTSLPQVRNDLCAPVFILACPRPCRLKDTAMPSRGPSPIAMPPKLLGTPTSRKTPTLTTVKAPGSSSSVENLGFLSKCECSPLVSRHTFLIFYYQARNSKLPSRVTEAQSFDPAHQSQKGKPNTISLLSKLLGCSPAPTHFPPRMFRCLSSQTKLIPAEQCLLSGTSLQSQSFRSVSLHKSRNRRRQHQYAMHLIHRSLRLCENPRSPALVTDGTLHTMQFCLAHIMECEYHIFLYIRLILLLTRTQEKHWVTRNPYREVSAACLTRDAQISSSTTSR